MKESVLKSLANAAFAIAQLAVPGAASVIELGRKALALIDDAKTAFGETTPELEEARGVLEAAVNAHVDDTIARLRGEDEA